MPNEPLHRTHEPSGTARLHGAAEQDDDNDDGDGDDGGGDDDDDDDDDVGRARSWNSTLCQPLAFTSRTMSCCAMTAGALFESAARRATRMVVLLLVAGCVRAAAFT